MSRFFIICYTLVLNGVILNAQSQFFKHFTTDNGLPHDITYQIIQDQEGFIWIGTDNGLVKFDGNHFKSYNYKEGLDSSFVIDIIENYSNQSFYIATWGAGVYQLKNDSIYHISVGQKKLTKIDNIHLLSNNLLYANVNRYNFSIYDLNKNQNQNYYLKNKNKERQQLHLDTIFSRNDSTNTQMLSNESIINDTLFIHSNFKGDRITDNVKGVYTLDIKTLKVTSIFHEVKNKKIYTITKADSMFFLGGLNTIYKYKDDRMIDSIVLPTNMQRTIIDIQVKDSTLYCIGKSITDASRVTLKYDLESEKLIDLSKEIGIKSMVSDNLIDKNGNLWITTYGEGVYMLPKDPPFFLGSNTFINHDLKDIGKLDSTLYVLSTNRLYKIKDKQILSSISITEHREKIQANKNNHSINIFGSYEGKKYKIQETPVNVVANKQFELLTEDGSILISNKNVKHGGELNAYKDGGKIYSISFKRDLLKEVYIHKGKLYIIRDNQPGIRIYDAYTGTLIETWDKTTGFPLQKVTKVLFHNHKIWIASNRGLFIVEENKIRKNFSEQKGLLSNHINDIYFDQHNILWIATQRGVNIYKNDIMYTLDKDSGQKSSFVTSIMELDDHIYISGNKGMFIKHNLYPFKVKSNTDIIIKKKEANFIVNPINYLNPNSIKIQYKINKDSWRHLNADTLFVQYLSHGIHKIQFKYKDGLSDWKINSPQSFTIYHPWYERPWFVTFLVIITSALLLVIISLKLEQSKAKNSFLKATLHERELLKKELTNVHKNIAQDFHDELGNKIASISVLSNLMSKKMKENTKEFKQIKKINRDSNSLYSGMRDFIWSLDQNSNELDHVFCYLKDFGEDLFSNSDITFYVENLDIPRQISLPYYWSKQLIFIFKEAMTNCIKHSKATEVVLHLNIQDDRLIISLHDNGIGCIIESLKRKNGLVNMTERAKKINSVLDIKNENGLKISFTGKLNL
ncbi:two-component regulator propeller domain-containing protein [Aquimarina sp. AU58]|uniref:sensor histidine kinase n=1 Tax=Aquimarina sp. AU58 TaxID=1874112 RepID=UPI000D6E4707|nr:two-component regulator propeller domain-containing protein [Aquimarina sp. AU58]